MGNRDKGFTIVVLLVAAAIIGILAVLLIFGSTAHPKNPRAKDSAAKADIMRLATACQAYQTDFGVYPPDDAAFSTVPLVKALSPIGRRGTPYYDFQENRLQNGEFVSAIGKPYHYRENRSKAAKTPDMHNPDSFDIWTQSAVDPKAADGINNWSK